MEHVRNLFKDSENLDVIVKGTVTGKNVNNQDEVLYQIESLHGDCFEADERCVYHDVTKPVVVKQFVADWYEKHKHDFEYSIWEYIYNWKCQTENAFNDWMNYTSNKPIETLVCMHKFGYEVEKDKQYTVKIKGDINENILVYGKSIQKYFFSSNHSIINKRSGHTKKQLEEAGFSGVFNNPMFEVKEVE